MADLQIACKVTKYFPCVQEKTPKIVQIIYANDCNRRANKRYNEDFFAHLQRKFAYLQKK